MRELDLLNACVDCEAFSEHTKSAITQLVMAHVEDFQVSLLD